MGQLCTQMALEGKAFFLFLSIWILWWYFESNIRSVILTWNLFWGYLLILLRSVCGLNKVGHISRWSEKKISNVTLWRPSVREQRIKGRSACQFACTNKVHFFNKFNKKILFMGKSGLINLSWLIKNLYSDVKVYFWSFI